MGTAIVLDTTDKDRHAERQESEGAGISSAQVFVVTTRSQKREREDGSDQGTREIDWGELGQVEKSPEKKRINLDESKHSKQDEGNQEPREKQSTLDEAVSEESDSSDLFSSDDNDEDWSGIKMAQRKLRTQEDRGRTGRKFATCQMLEETGDHPGAEPILSQANNRASKLPRVRDEQHIRAEIQITSTPRKDLIIQRPQREINPPLSHRNRKMFGNTVNESGEISESLGKESEELQPGTLVSSKSKEVDLDNCLMETDSTQYVGAPKQDSELNISIERTQTHGRDSMQIESKKDKPELKWNVERFSSGGRIGVQVLVWNEEQESIEQRPQTGEPSNHMQSRYNRPEYQPRVELTRLEIPTVGNSSEILRTPFTIGETAIYRRNEERGVQVRPNLPTNGDIENGMEPSTDFGGLGKENINESDILASCHQENGLSMQDATDSEQNKQQLTGSITLPDSEVADTRGLANNEPLQGNQNTDANTNSASSTPASQEVPGLRDEQEAANGLTIRDLFEGNMEVDELSVHDEGSQEQVNETPRITQAEELSHQDDQAPPIDVTEFTKEPGKRKINAFTLVVEGDIVYNIFIVDKVGPIFKPR
ncbi:hypothetical protein QAD02_022066 [Eretmocerus hayati]|uniref:Uncharacterized protein n=2 Tax=Eretmocerus hayati TaxID=131215 RepID=A0ACC2PS85_9HYME|nr:hypothetical protein QAD02_016755 [Eretmocerus hayati]KAJ8686272.1 hypothetical protein QAD02_022066 [Eretmocerus hayati]